MKRLLNIIGETFLLLRRDRVFLPVVVIMIAAMVFADIASYWGTEEYKKILYDVGLGGIDLAGALVAIFWGTKVISDSKREGTLELQLAAPISRSYWVIGKFIGLCATLVFLGMCMMVFWQLFLLVDKMGWMEDKHIIIFAYQTLGWMVLAALSVFFASMSGQMTAMFCCLSLYILGLITGNIAKTLHPTTPDWLQTLARTTAKFWDLQRFNLSEYASIEGFVSPADLSLRAVYGLTLCLFFMSVAAILFTRKDVASQ